MPQDSGFSQILFLYVPIGLIFYFLILRPQQQQQKKLKQMLATMKKNDEVVTNSGIHGSVVIVKDKTVVVRVDEGCRIEFDKDAIALVKTETAIKPEVIK